VIEQGLREIRGSSPDRARRVLSEIGIRLAALALWSLFFRLVALTLVASLLISPETRFAQISDAFASIELIVAGLGMFLFVALGRALRPLSHPRLDDLISTWRLEKKYLPGLAWGALIGILWTASTLLGGTAEWVGTNLSYDEAALTLTNTTLRTLAILVLVWCDEHFFRVSIQGRLQRALTARWAILAAAVAFSTLKLLQFELGISQWLTLFLLSCNLGARSIKDGDFGKGAGLWSGFLLVIHPLLSLPVLGNDIQGIFMVKNMTPETSLPHADLHRWISGGIGGPLSSPVLQLLLALDTAIRWRKIFLGDKSRG